MILKSIRLVNFRCHREKRIDFENKIALIVGPNGTGKTTVLEAIHYLSRLKSHRTSLSGEMIAYGQDALSISATTADEEVITIYKEKDRRQIYHDNTLVSPEEHYGSIPLVILAASDMSLVTQGDKIRRSYLNALMAHENLLARNWLVKYDRILQQRAAELRKEKPHIPTLRLLTTQLADVGIPLQQIRKKLAKKVAVLASRIFHTITRKEESITMSISTAGWEIDLQNEINQRRNLIGLQRDTITIKLNNRDAAKYASEGQQRSIAVALKAAEFLYLKKITNRKPLLLIDDVQKELDPERTSAAESLLEQAGQVIMTRTQQTKTIREVQTITL